MTHKPITIGQAIDQILEALEGLDPTARGTVLNTVATHLGVNVSLKKDVTADQNKSKVGLDTPPVTPPPPPEKPTAIDIRTLRQQKKPDSANQMACLVAYYLQELASDEERSDTLKTTDLEKYFKQAGYPLPNDISQVLRDCKRAGYLESVSRGSYKLNAVGYNLVAHKLPKKSGDG